MCLFDVFQALLDLGEARYEMYRRGRRYIRLLCSTILRKTFIYFTECWVRSVCHNSRVDACYISEDSLIHIARSRSLEGQSSVVFTP